MNDWHGRPLVRIEPAVWTWRGQAMHVDDSVDRAMRAYGRSQQLRIGDAERDQAVAALGDHFAAGRLSREEFDERSDRALGARVQGDLEPLFADLPRSRPQTRLSAPPRMPQAMFFAFAMLAPLLIVTGVIAAVVLSGVFSAPWVLWTFLMVFLFSGLWRHRRPAWHRDRT